MAQSILYYPKIDIQDGAWLRNAILYWDEVSSIVPYEEYDNLSVELQYLKNLGVYSPIYPRDLFVSEYAGEFCSVVVKRIASYDRTITNKPKGIPGERARVHVKKIYAPALYELIHYEKLPPDLLGFFKDKRFIKDYNCGGWMEIDSQIAEIYMKTLAEYSIKCSDKDIVLGTATTVRNREIYGQCSCRKGTQTQCCRINIEKCLPQPTMDISFEDILNFKVKRQDELYAFRKKIRELEIKINKANSPEEIRHYEEDFVESWKTCADDFKKVLKDAKIPFLLSSLVSIVAIPLVGEFLAQKVDPNFASAVQVGAAGIGIGLDYLNYKNKISPAKTDGGFSYIIKANNDGIVHI